MNEQFILDDYMAKLYIHNLLYTLYIDLLQEKENDLRNYKIDCIKQYIDFNNKMGNEINMKDKETANIKIKQLGYK